ncbi:MAG: class C sortase [Clostridiales bacterium]|nr:class C sortase [Clostridiales bacterium]
MVKKKIKKNKKDEENKMVWWKKLIAILVFAAGVSLMAYPWISNWLYNRATEASVQAYEEETAAAEAEDLYEYWTDAREYNDSLLQADVVLADPFTYESVSLADGPGYEGLLNLDGSGIMCFISIPKIDVYLPVYHGTSEESLSKGAGHVEGTALPTGTVGGRPIISAHTGVNSAKMFSDLTQLEEGDLFFLYVLDTVYAYRVVETDVIEPDDVSSIDEEPGRDLVTLMTCTPYGVNSHRLIVTGERTAYTKETVDEAESEEMAEDTEWMRAYKKALFIGICIVALFLAAAMLVRAAVRRRKGMQRRKGGSS